MKGTFTYHIRAQHRIFIAPIKAGQLSSINPGPAMVVRTSSRETKFLNLSANHIRASILQPITSELQSFSQSHRSFNLSANHIRAIGTNLRGRTSSTQRLPLLWWLYLFWIQLNTCSRRFLRYWPGTDVAGNRRLRLPVVSDLLNCSWRTTEEPPLDNDPRL